MFDRMKCITLEWRRYLFSSRLILFIAMLSVAIDCYQKPIMRFSKAIDYPVAPWILPFIFNSVYMQFLYGIAVIYYYSTVPFADRNQMYRLLRMGHVRWVFEKLIIIWISAALLPLIIFSISIIRALPNIEWTYDWGRLLHTLAASAAGEQYGVHGVSYSIINSYTPLQAMARLWCVIFFITGFIGTVMFALAVCTARSVAISAATSLSILTIITANITSSRPMITVISPLSWMNIDVFNHSYGPVLFTLATAVGVLTICSVILSITVLLWRSKTDIKWSEDDA